MDVNQIVSSPKLFFTFYLTLVHSFLILTHGVHTTEEKYDNAEAYCMVLTVLLTDVLVKRDVDMYNKYVQLFEEDQLRNQQQEQQQQNEEEEYL